MSDTTITRLDATKRQDVSYCIPLWLRDEQIKRAIARTDKRIQPGARRDDRVAVVGFGPSLAETWEELRDFPLIITCSGAHKFLRERGLTPTWHVEVDPRPHKVGLIGEPCADTTYLIASTCHPKLFDHLEGMTVLLWHVFDSKEEGKRVLPHGEWAITGGCDVGSRAITIAGFLGFRDVHVFGMDGCEKHGGKHAAEHPNEAKGHSVTEYKGVEYRTTPGLLEAARQLAHELDEMPAVHATFHGEGLVQAMMRDYQQKPSDASRPFENMVAFTKPALISADYAALNAKLHRDNLAYGVGGGKHADTILKLSQKLGTTSILDYGCGKGYLAKELPFPIWEYDPAIEGKDQSPRPAEIVVCTDVLEHIEPTHIFSVLSDLKRCTKQLGYFVIHTGPSSKTLADGRNTHILQHDRGWWKKKLGRYFTVGKIFEQGPLLTILVVPKKKLVGPVTPAAPTPQPEEALV